MVDSQQKTDDPTVAETVNNRLVDFQNVDELGNILHFGHIVKPFYLAAFPVITAVNGVYGVINRQLLDKYPENSMILPIAMQQNNGRTFSTDVIK